MQWVLTPSVSIHAPWEGCDLEAGLPQKGASSVSIHAPWEGCDYRFNPFRLLAYQFQFTHPGKGATRARREEHTPFGSFNSRTLGRVRPLSIGHKGRGYMSFNSRTLGRVRRVPINHEYPVVVFQFTHPGKGATSSTKLLPPKAKVSIHAPWEGCDYLSLDPLSHCGMFQFTHPGKGATHC